MAILGPNGAGKSTSIRSIMGIILPDEGDITFHGHSSGKRIPRHLIGYLPEERGLYKNVKVMDMLLYLAELPAFSSLMSLFPGLIQSARRSSKRKSGSLRIKGRPFCFPRIR
ncbi:antibiotic resistance ABC transporter, efflux system, ATP-binding protein [Mycobacteroides abscessus subsp. abscessus]|nr:antibiotic resistance ABC transporter, efflux system, ATP-binding protein [Mycobacteroides abscessus subsp. abscessus]